MANLPRDIVDLVYSDKRIAITPKWDEASDSRYLQFTVPLQFGEVTIGGFDLRVKLSKHHIDRDCLAQLEYAPEGRRSAEPLWRIEWRPFSVHSNPGWGPPGFEFDTYEQRSHNHRFEDNYMRSEHRIRSGNLPGAIPVEPDPGTISEFLAFCGGEFRISDMERVQLPVQTHDMFWTPK